MRNELFDVIENACDAFRWGRGIFQSDAIGDGVQTASAGSDQITSAIAPNAS